MKTKLKIQAKLQYYKINFSLMQVAKNGKNVKNI